MKNKLNKYYLNSDLFVLPSYYEGLPNVMLDAMNHEIPIISTNCSGASDILQKNSGGFIIPINDQNELEKKIVFVMKNYSIAKNKIINAKKKYICFLTKILSSTMNFFAIYLDINKFLI